MRARITSRTSSRSWPTAFETVTTMRSRCPTRRLWCMRALAFRIPQGPLQTILHRMSRDKLLKRKHGIYYRMPEALAEFDLGPDRADVLRQHAHLVALLIDFAARLGRQWDEAQA